MSIKAIIGNDILLNKEFLAKMKAVGVFLEGCTRIIIDIPAGEACTVYAYHQKDSPLSDYRTLPQVVESRVTGHEIFQSKEVRQKMIDAGILPDDCARITIDIPADGLFKVYTETLLKRKEEAISVVCDIAGKIAADEKKEEGD